MISSSPDRNTFQKEGYIKRCEEQGKVPDAAYIQMYTNWQQQKLELEETNEWKTDNMEYDLRSTQWIIDKVKVMMYMHNIFMPLYVIMTLLKMMYGLY